MSQNDMILNYLQNNGSLTQADAISLFGCYRLGARIFEIRSLGFDVRREMEQGVNRYGEKTRYARYWLKDKRQGLHDPQGL